MTGGGKATSFVDTRDHAMIRMLTEGVRREELAQQQITDLSEDLITRPFVRVVFEWIEKWNPLACRALEAFAELLAEAPTPLDADAVAAASPTKCRGRPTRRWRRCQVPPNHEWSTGFGSIGLPPDKVAQRFVAPGGWRKPAVGDRATPGRCR